MPLLWLSLAFLAGIVAAEIAHLPSLTWLILAGVSLMLALTRFIFKRSKMKRVKLPFSLAPPLPILLLAFTLGGYRYQTSLPDFTDPAFIGFHNDIERQQMITGVIETLPDERDTYTYLRVETEKLFLIKEGQLTNVQGLLLIRVSPEQKFHYGDRITIRGYLETPPENEDFSYRDYLARQGVYSYITRSKISILQNGQGNWFMTAIFKLKEKALGLVYRLWPDPEASLFAGILLGVETGIPEPVKQAFKDTGTSHVIAISGFNITIVAGLFASFFGRFLGKRKGAIAAVIGITIYTVLVGADAAVVRSAIMGGFSLFARQVGRRQQGVNTLAITAALMALANPNVPWDVGFQLSFAAALGLILYADPMAQAFKHGVSHFTSEKTAKRLTGPVSEYFLFTIAAQITTLPIMAYHFGQISWSAFLTNPVILPVQPPIMTLGGLAVILGVIWLPLGKLAAPLAWPFVLFTIRAVEFFAKNVHGVLVLGDLALFWVILFYAVLLSGTFGWSRFSGWIAARKERISAAIAGTAMTGLGILAVVLWRGALAAPDGRLHLTLFNVGTGDAILVQAPGGRYLLIDGGPSASLLSDGMGRRLPPFHRQLDWLIVASPRSEQIAGLPKVLERFSPINVLWAGPQSPARDADYLRENLTNLEIPVIPAQAGQTLDLGNGAVLQVLTSGERGAVLLLEWDHFRALFPLGANDVDLEFLKMGKSVGQVTVLLLADNGYGPLNPPAWISNLRPQLILLSVAADDRDGLPNRETLDTLGGYSLLRTDQNGWIQISTDGQRMWVEVER